jgi:hypothetical protein
MYLCLRNRERIDNDKLSKENTLRAVNQQVACLRFCEAEGNIDAILVKTPIVCLWGPTTEGLQS